MTVYESFFRRFQRITKLFMDGDPDETEPPTFQEATREVTDSSGVQLPTEHLDADSAGSALDGTNVRMVPSQHDKPVEGPQPALSERPPPGRGITKPGEKVKRVLSEQTILLNE